MSDLVQINQWWPKKVKEELQKLWPKKYNSLTAATLDAVRKLIKELKEEA